MMAKYPNLELIEYKFKQFVFSEGADILKNACFLKFRADTFMQTWADTATGFNLKRGFAGQAFTDEYTTVMEMRWCVYEEDDKRKWHDSKDVIYGVFFGNELAYLFINPKEQFFEDLKNRRMLAQREAMETYDSLDGEADEVKLKEEE